MTPLVIAVNAVRRGRGGPFVAAAVAYDLCPPEPRFHFIDGRGMPRAEFLLRKVTPLKPHLISAVSQYLERVSVATGKYYLAPEKAPADPKVARMTAMFWAVRKVADRLRHFRAGAPPSEIVLLVAGDAPLRTKYLANVEQRVCATESDWRLQAALFHATHAFTVRS